MRPGRFGQSRLGAASEQNAGGQRQQNMQSIHSSSWFSGWFNAAGAPRLPDGSSMLHVFG
jgi:hypothetical protein